MNLAPWDWAEHGLGGRSAAQTLHVMVAADPTRESGRRNHETDKIMRTCVVLLCKGEWISCAIELLALQMDFLPINLASGRQEGSGFLFINCQ